MTKVTKVYELKLELFNKGEDLADHLIPLGFVPLEAGTQTEAETAPLAILLAEGTLTCQDPEETRIRTFGEEEDALDVPTRKLVAKSVDRSCSPPTC